MSKAEELFKRYCDGGADYVLRIANAGVSETLHLDFKQKNERGDMDDLTYYAKALSGFANAEGGILVWGVVCRPGANEDPDVTQQAIPINGLANFISLLERKTDEYIQPGLNGVQHRALELSESPDCGFVVTFIPRSEGPPQMSVVKNARGYFCRINARTKPMEHYQIADRFRERPQPRLEVFLKGGIIEGSNTASSNQQVDICVRNVGAGIANNVAVSLFGSTLRILVHSGIERKLNIFPVDGDISWITLAMQQGEPLFPGSYTKLAYFTWFFPSNFLSNNEWAPATIEYRAFCDGASAQGTLFTEPG